MRVAFLSMLLSYFVVSHVHAGVIFQEDFESSVPTEITVTAGAGRVGTQTYSNHGFGSWMLENGTPNAVTTLTLSGLAPHTSIDIGFSLGIIDSWDGSPDTPPVSPDIFNVSVDGSVVFSETFDNFDAAEQSYVPPAGVELASRVPLGFGGGIFDDSAYDMSKDPTFTNIAHTSNTLTIRWFTSGAGIQQFGDESWSIDNIIISINNGSTGGSGTVPEPTSAMFWLGLGAIVSVRKRRRA
ncbi:PEP-CTERM sorting domain-containing protein [Roseiconus lacunae]|uniref:PEP-CTERM sorting domain-containing protein n=1 Tax=Roseiconus lacunae TaxID=2605694 RepID=UPI0011F22D44|nr:PEP-CTERM sorting domain-containing protein [Roseiconus lacunae]MCD0461598.1 hypothetical protein [Roseiconus lacunae]WRQ51063.1 hypothetical protein U8335_00655 [Stieleria sp. HD01]